MPPARRERRAGNGFRGSAQRTEEGAQVGGQVGRILHGREVQAAFEFGPVGVGGGGDDAADRLVRAEDREALGDRRGAPHSVE